MKKNPAILILMIATLFSGCEKVTDFYIGIPEQPDFKNSDFHPGMNILGILRPDNKNGLNMSFVYIQKVLPATSAFSEELNIPDATVRIFEPGVGDSVLFRYDNPSRTFSDSAYRSVIPFNPQKGKMYGVVCHYAGLPDAVGIARMPDPPAIDLTSVTISDNILTFSVLPDTTIRMIDVYLVGQDNSAFLNRTVPDSSSAAIIQVDISGAGASSFLRIFVYDANLAEYYANTNTSLNFNKFRTTYSTMISGYGVFGALNFSDIILP